MRAITTVCPHISAHAKLSVVPQTFLGNVNLPIVLTAMLMCERSRILRLATPAVALGAIKVRSQDDPGKVHSPDAKDTMMRERAEAGKIR